MLQFSGALAKHVEATLDLEEGASNGKQASYLCIMYVFSLTDQLRSIDLTNPSATIENSPTCHVLDNIASYTKHTLETRSPTEDL